MDTFVIPLSGDLGAAARAACDGAGAAGVAPCPLRNRENMGCLLIVAAIGPAAIVFLIGLILDYATERRFTQSRAVIPAKAGTHATFHTRSKVSWIPAFAGMTAPTAGLPR